jgi:hypothetical protein
MEDQEIDFDYLLRKKEPKIVVESENPTEEHYISQSEIRFQNKN